MPDALQVHLVHQVCVLFSSSCVVCNFQLQPSTQPQQLAALALSCRCSMQLWHANNIPLLAVFPVPYCHVSRHTWITHA